MTHKIIIEHLDNQLRKINIRKNCYSYIQSFAAFFMFWQFSFIKCETR